MKRMIVLLLVLLLLAVPVSAQWDLLYDGEGLLSTQEAIELESAYADFAASHGITPILVTTGSFDGMSAESFAANWYDSHGYPRDGILLLVSLSEGQWYILTNGACYEKISDWEAQSLGEQIVSGIRKGDYYTAFSVFPELVSLQMQGADAYHDDTEPQNGNDKNYPKTVAICMGAGLLIGLIAVGIMAAQMKTVRPQRTASNYIRSGSMQLTNSRDIFLYSHVTRTAKPKNNSSGGGGGSRGGAGGRI